MMRDKSKRVQAVLIRAIHKFALLMNHEERAAAADAVALIGELVERVEQLEREINGKISVE